MMKQHFELLILQPKMTDGKTFDKKECRTPLRFLVDGHEASDQSVLTQTESMHKAGTIWSAVLKADREAIGLQIVTNPKILETRGGVGECPIHMLFLYGSDAHLNIARELLTECPELAKQIYNEKVTTNENQFSHFSSIVAFSCITEKIFFISLLSNNKSKRSDGYFKRNN